MANQTRVHKISERIRSILAMHLLRLSDPRFQMVTITGVRVTTDLRLAKVYWGVTGGKEKIKLVEDGFESAKGILRRELALELGIKFVPELKFYYDDTLDIIDETQALMKKVAEIEKKTES